MSSSRGGLRLDIYLGSYLPSLLLTHTHMHRTDTRTPRARACAKPEHAQYEHLSN